MGNIYFITPLIAALYQLNHLYYLNGNQGIDLSAASIIIIVMGIYDSRWRVSSRLRLHTIGWKYNHDTTSFSDLTILTS